MMKYLTQCLSVLLLSLACSLNGQDVQISLDHPERVNAGEDFEVTVTITKGSLTDYSRFSQDLPLGLTARNVNSPNADFSFDEQRVRIIWLKLPNVNEVKVNYMVSVDARLKGTFTIGGVFAYVVNDERKFLTVDQQKQITIIPSSTVDPANIVDIQDFKEGAAAPALTTAVDTPAGNASRGDVFAMAVRQKPQLLNSGAYQVHLSIKNPSGSKYAKVEETIPSGYVFEEVNNSEGIVSHAASTVKFIWMALPNQPVFDVVYRLVPKQGEPQGNMHIDGLLTYTAANENVIEEIVEVDVSLKDLSLAQKTDLLATGNVPQAGRATTTATAARTEPRTQPRTQAGSIDSGSASSSIISNTKVLDRGTGTYFRVQLTANTTPFDATSFYRDAGVTREVLVEQHNGYYKYTVGPFQTYDQALLYKEQVDRLEEVNGAFVVGYRNGNRVSAGSIR